MRLLDMQDRCIELKVKSVKLLLILGIGLQPIKYGNLFFRGCLTFLESDKGFFCNFHHLYNKQVTRVYRYFLDFYRILFRYNARSHAGI